MPPDDGRAGPGRGSGQRAAGCRACSRCACWPRCRRCMVCAAAAGRFLARHPQVRAARRGRGRGSAAGRGARRGDLVDAAAAHPARGLAVRAAGGRRAGRAARRIRWRAVAARGLRWDELQGRVWMQAPVVRSRERSWTRWRPVSNARCSPSAGHAHSLGAARDARARHAVLALPRSYLRRQVDAGELAMLPLAEPCCPSTRWAWMAPSDGAVPQVTCCANTCGAAPRAACVTIGAFSRRHACSTT